MQMRLTKGAERNHQMEEMTERLFFQLEENKESVHTIQANLRKECKEKVLIVRN